MIDKELEHECESYKNALLYGKKSKADELHSVLKEKLPDAEAFFRDCDQWLEKCNAMLDRAVAAAHKGLRRDSLDFEQLAHEADELRGGAKGALCQRFDAAVEDYLNNNAESPLAIKEESTPAIPKEARLFLAEIQKFASWGKNGEQDLKKNREQLLRLYPDSENWIQKYIEKGKKLKEHLVSAYKLGARNGSKKDLQNIQKKMSREGYGSFLCQKAKEQYNTGLMRFQRGKEAREYKPKDHFSKRHFDKFKIKIGDLSYQERETMSFTGIHPNALCQLSPSPRWTILVDETGNNFSGEVFQSPNTPQKEKNQIGRIVGLFVPEGEEKKLPPLPSAWHAVDNSLSEIEQVTESILTSKCGVLGVSINAFSRVHADQWLFGIEALLDLALRLLPIEDETVFDLYVEQRGSVTPSNPAQVKALCENVLNRFRRVRPDLAEKITFHPKVITKTGHPLNGYVDAAAFLWNGSTAQKIFKNTQWIETCFLGKKQFSLCDIIDLMEREGLVLPELWTSLVSSREAESINSFVSALLRQLGEFARVQPEHWRQYLNHLLCHLDSKAIDMRKLERQISWLKEYAPEETKLPPRLRLLWLTAKLAQENHRGDAAYNNYRDEFQSLVTQLYDEDAPLVCNAMLHLAVALTNEYDFDGAKETLADWREIPEEVPGRRLYGRLLSSFGQHEAFVGNNAAAIPYFQKAIQTFENLSDSGEAALDVEQTRAYLLIAMMDAEKRMQFLMYNTNAHSYRRWKEKQWEKNNVRFSEEISLYFGASLADAADSLSQTGEAKDKYRHHLLLRYLTGTDSEEAQAARNRYLKNRALWQTGEGHPWELIEFYRGLLLTEKTQKLGQFRKALKIANEGGLTLQAIAVVILGLILTLNSIEQEEYLAAVEDLRTKLPLLGKRLEILAEQPEQKRSPQDLAAAVLPFNFR